MCVQGLAIMNKAAVKTYVQVFVVGVSFQPLGIDTKGCVIVRSYGKSMFCRKLSNSFSVVVPFCIFTAVNESSCCSVFWTVSGIVSGLDFDQSNRCGVYLIVNLQSLVTLDV